MADTTIESLGKQIGRDRRDAGMSLGQVATATGLSKSTIHRIENDTLENRPSPASLQKIARALGTEVEDYFALAGYLTPQGLPGLAPYLRAKYDVSEEMADRVEEYFRFLRASEQEK